SNIPGGLENQLTREGSGEQSSPRQICSSDRDRRNRRCSSAERRCREPVSAVGGAGGHGPVQSAGSTVSDLHDLLGGGSACLEREAQGSGQVVEKCAASKYRQIHRQDHRSPRVGILREDDFGGVIARPKRTRVNACCNRQWRQAARVA